MGAFGGLCENRLKMELDVTQVLLAVLSGTTIGSVVEAVRYWRQNKLLKQNEVKKDDVATQREQINLADEYLQKVMELSEKNYQQAMKNGVDNENIIKKIDAVAAEQRSIVAYLNGDYQEFLHKRGFTGDR